MKRYFVKKKFRFLEKFYIYQTHIKRNDIFTSNNYAQWLAPEDKNQFKEIQLLNFDQVQKQEYFKKFSIQSITMLIFDISEGQVYPQNPMDIKKFELSWQQIEVIAFKVEIRDYFKLKINRRHILFLKVDDFITLKNNGVTRSSKINLQKSWSFEKYDGMMKQVNLNQFWEFLIQRKQQFKHCPK
ncbi:unnamed protein product [Paramecium pentaurelia]|uniref:Uncharacterized protein n=1 Tax=Paramecium pentaurelia TaxID=43138 RepID=A0A8S1X167_9CILI|nr:unnamed protein product [Paramecium pentaurelia]